MTDAGMILVYILAAALAVFLILAIFLTVLLIKISQRIRTITDSAAKTVDNVQQFTTNVSTFSSPVAIAKIVKNFITDNRK